MTETILGLVADYGTPALTWVLTLLGGLLARYVWVRISNEWARGVAERAWEEVKAAVLGVAQVYADAIKAGRADGKLTREERLEAKQRAIGTAKKNLGKKGLRALARIVGLDEVDNWLATRVEAAVRTLPPPTKEVAASTPGKP